MCFCPASRLLVAFGAVVLLAGCIGEPRTYFAAKPIMLQRRAVAQVWTKSAPAPPAPPLSADEKQQLFQEFQASQSFKGHMVTAPQAAW